MAPDASDAFPVRQKVQFLNAARTGNLNLLKNLVGQLNEVKGLAITVADIKDPSNRGVLHFAANAGQTEVCKYLLEDLKLDVDTKDNGGKTPLIHAALQRRTDTAKYLLECGANPDVRVDSGTTLLHRCAAFGEIELLRILLSKGVDIDPQIDAGTPLMVAAALGQEESVKVLLEHHASLNFVTDKNVTPMAITVASSSLACLELLIQAGANVNFSFSGATPLHMAAYKGSLEIINCLLKAGADPNATEVGGEKPIQVAAARGYPQAVEILFPLTSKVEAIPNWTVDGILEYMQFKRSKEQVAREAKKKATEAKSRGDDAFKRKEYHMAVEAYTQATDFDPTDATLLSNRSLCWMCLGQAEDALADAKSCRTLRPDWPKACYQEAAVLRLLQRFDEAANSFYEGVMLDPENKELANAFREAVEAGKKKS
ncbi:uncharacterized protein LOC132173055 [Corylus avellana]|uniref:uncharacterized protein LOC132173055 n=1 Tax=Corylus avellana TaxID=13451 RepID=UPI00286C22C4|nr:uncharacterized protein LOC132173055 [Corylus avellana]